MRNLDKTTRMIKKAFHRWARPLGLLWWHIDTIYYDDHAEIVDRFLRGDETVAARTYADWRYMTARIEINLIAFSKMDQDEIERVVVHELIHILVNEMREGDISHEERVVTTLTKAAFWLTDK